MRPFVLLLACLACGLPAGCQSFRPSARDYADEANDPDGAHDEWDSVRQEGRGTDATEHEWDKWTPKLMSPKAMAIERNLGYGY
jgi:hypothetical protein